MNQDLGLRVLGRIMNWSDDGARREYAWLRLMARLKYDGYRDFQAGARFIESLANWLQQFDTPERQTAYDFIRRYLVYIGPTEMQKLVEQFYPRFVEPRIFRTATEELEVRPYEVLTNGAASASRERLLRQTLFMGLSDGARIDTIRHANAGRLNNEQIVHSTQIDVEKWKDLLDKLREDLNENDARFRAVYLLDDFAGTGSSFLRHRTTRRAWTGKLIRFLDSVKRARTDMDDDDIFSSNWEVNVHYYIASSRAVEAIDKGLEKIKGSGDHELPHTMSSSYGMVLPSDLPIDAVEGLHDDFIALTQRYYDPQIRTKHTDIGGAEHLGLGYGGSALPLVLEHNTPNNSVALLWAETDGRSTDGAQFCPMRPLFRRRQRHT